MALAGPALPVEVWSHILKEIPKAERLPLLNVCSLFHDILVPFLFSSIKIYFIGGESGRAMLNTTDRNWMEETAEILMRKSWELLNYIRQEPRFAKVVRSITVVAYADGPSVFERMTLASTLMDIPSLHTFRWIGVNPAFDGEVAECLPVGLEKLVVQSSLPLDSLQHLMHTTTLQLSMPFFFPDDEEAHDCFVHDVDIEYASHLEYPIEFILESMSSTLRSLRVTATQVRGVPIRVYNQLTELEIFATIGDLEELVGLDLVFRHATALESLALVGYFNSAIFSFLPPSSTGILPCLTSFRLSCECYNLEGFGEAEIYALCKFLQNRHNLRRLYVRIPTLTWNEIYPLLPTIKDLKGLEVLGLHTGAKFLEEEEIEALTQLLSTKLRALHLAVKWGGERTLPLVDAIAMLPDLSFLHLYGAVGRLPFQPGDFASDGKRLQTIGLNRALWTITRVGQDIMTEKWPRWRIKFCVEDDFVCADDYWLFKYL